MTSRENKSEGFRVEIGWRGAAFLVTWGYIVALASFNAWSLVVIMGLVWVALLVSIARRGEA